LAGVLQTLVGVVETIAPCPWTDPTQAQLTIRIVPAPAVLREKPRLEPEYLIDVLAENAGLRAALASAEATSVRRELVSQELKHRIGNLISVIQAIARKTFRDADAARVEDFNARLWALSAAQALLIDSETKPATLLYVVQHALAPHASNDKRFVVTGPEIALGGRQAHALTVALHELATNAAKYGALSTEQGVVEISWSGADGELLFTWRERGGPPVSKPTRIGFGTSLITTNLKSAFDGAVELSFEESGVACQLRAPMPLGA
jgi:two-component sensor histidine kinase